MSVKKITVIGAGLVGSLFSIFLRKRGFEVDIFERREDMRKKSVGAGRSINLVLTKRGITALKKVGLEKDALEITIPVFGRMIHSTKGEETYQPYGKDESECNYSVSRGELNKLLIDKAEQAGVKIHFEHNLESAQFDGGKLLFITPEGKKEIEASYVIGADGSSSHTRRELMKTLKERNITHENRLQDLGSGYKELLMPASDSGDYPISKNALHIWPRGHHMFMALPNLDGSFTMTLYLHDEEKPTFAEIENEDQLISVFEKYYKDSIELMPELKKEFFENAVGKLATVFCKPWHYADKVVLIGDAAHGIVPFFGQGMNAGFEDCTVLDSLMERFDNDFEKSFAEFTHFQKDNGDAIAHMALDNFIEMKDRVGDEKFLFEKKVEQLLGQKFPNQYWSRYRLVIYTDIPYKDAQNIGKIQREILSELCQNIDSTNDVDLELAKKLIEEKLLPYYEKEAVVLK